MLSLIIFLSLATLVIAHFLWQEWRVRRQRELARQEFQELMLKQKREAVAHAEAQQQTLFNSMLEGVLILDPVGRVQLTNQSLNRLLGIRSEIRGRCVQEAFRIPELTSLVQRLGSEKRIKDFEFELPGQKPKHIQVNAAVIGEEDRTPRGYIIVFHDLTRIKELENTRKEFVANVSHELRTPLSMIKGFAETLLDGAKDDPAVAARFLHNIDKHADRLLFLIEDLLTISRLESRQVALNQDSVVLRDVAQRVLVDLQQRGLEKAIVFENHISSELYVWADADRLQQVVMNLVDNAIKYGKAGGHIVVRARPIDNQMIEVSVHDDGPGIPREAQERIFERFYRLDKARARDTGGTGLGLAIVKHIVLAHGGNVWVKSEAGEGASFYVTLPATGQHSHTSE